MSSIQKKTVFGIHNPYIAKDRKILNLFGREIRNTNRSLLPVLTHN